MTLSRSFPNKTSEGPVQTGEAYADRVKEEGDALWARAIDWLGSVSGTNTITATSTAPYNAYTKGNAFLFNPANSNTGAVTININGLGAKNLKSAAGNDLVSGELVTGQTYLIFYDGTEFRCIVNMTASNVQKTLKHMQVFNSSGTWNKPNEVNSDSIIVVQIVAAGGGGSRAGAGNGGGQGGQYFSLAFKGSDIVGSSVSVTVGAGGAGRASTNGAGTNGGNTSFGSFITVPGGKGGQQSNGSDVDSPTFSGSTIGSLYQDRQLPTYIDSDGSLYISDSEHAGGSGAGGVITSPITPLFSGAGGADNGSGTGGAGTAPGGGGGRSSTTGGAGAAGRVTVYVL